MANYPAKVWNGTSWLGVGTQIADLSPYALKDGSNMAGYGAWTSYTPSFAHSGASLGNATCSAAYTRYGKTVVFRAMVTFGSTTNMGTGPARLGLPVAPLSTGAAAFAGLIHDNSGTDNWYSIAGLMTAGGGTDAYLMQTSNNTWVTSTSPFTWTTGDQIYLSGTYEAA